MRLAAAVAALAGLVAGQAALRPQPYPGAFDAYLCQPQLADAAGDAWAFDMTPVAAVNFTIATDKPYAFVAAGCGVLDTPCLPGWGVDWPYNSALQIFPGSKGSGACWDPASNASAPCTGECEALGRGAPQWSLLDPSNASAGLAVTFAAVFGSASDPHWCPHDPILGTAMPRTVVIRYACDPRVPAGQVEPEAAVEDPTCTYTLTARTAAACPTPSSSKAPLPPPSDPAVPAADNTGPDAPYLCQPVLDDASGKPWSFDFTRLYRKAGSEYAFADAARNMTYNLNICGYTSATCAPQPYPVQYNWGAMTMYWGAPAEPNATCTFVDGTVAPCTMNCEVLGAGAPVWTLLDAANGAAGGVSLQYWGLVRLPEDPFPCPPTAGGTQSPMAVNINIACDPATEGLAITAVEEMSKCAYTVTASSAAACGTKA
jgi:hypothetical protein